MDPQSSQMLPQRSPRCPKWFPSGQKCPRGPSEVPQRHPRAPKWSPRGPPEAPNGIPGAPLGDVWANTSKKAPKIMKMLILHWFFNVFKGSQETCLSKEREERERVESCGSKAESVSEYESCFRKWDSTLKSKQ